MDFSFAVESTAWASLGMAAASVLYVVIDMAHAKNQKMPIMYVVWATTALWAGPLGAWAYAQWGRQSDPKDKDAVVAARATTHCGAGCTLGDVVAEVVAVFAPLTLFGHRIFGSWVYDLVAAYALGIAFQYLTIKPMKGLSAKDGIVEALKADTLSLLAWQVGMYGAMAFFRFFVVGHELPKGSPVFWLLMQLAMFCGFAVSFPVNAWLVRRGTKPRM